LKRLLVTLSTVTLACSESTPPSSPVATVELSLDTMTIVPGATMRLRAIARDSSGAPLAGFKTSWFSTDTRIVDVDTLGVLNARATGTVAVIARVDGHADSTRIGVVQVTFVQVSAGANHACGLTALGRAFCWGNGFAGALGFGDTINSTAPVAVAGGLSFTTISAGYSYTCALTTTGIPYCWGSNFVGQLGLGNIDTAAHVVPQPVTGSPTLATLDAGAFHTCGRSSSGAAYCWGYNSQGENGDGQRGIIEPAPHTVVGGVSFASVTTGQTHSCGVASDSTAFCWGNGSAGILGLDSFPAPCVSTGTGPQCPEPMLVVGSTKYPSLEAGWSHTCALVVGGAAYCWGSNQYGQLGTGTPADFSATPVVVSGGHTFVSLSSGTAHSCALTSAGEAWCWGAGGDGRLGDGSGTSGSYSSSSPLPAAGGLIFAVLSAGGGITCGVTTSGTTYCWGANDYGQLGIGADYASVPMKLTPTRILGQP